MKEDIIGLTVNGKPVGFTNGTVELTGRDIGYDKELLVHLDMLSIPNDDDANITNIFRVGVLTKDNSYRARASISKYEGIKNDILVTRSNVEIIGQTE